MTNDNSKQSEPRLNIPEKVEISPQSDDRFAADLRGFGLLGILAIVVIILSGNIFLDNVLVPVGAVLVLLWVRRSHTPWREIGYVRPRSWIGSLVVGLIFGITFKFLMKAIVMPLLGADAINQPYHYLVGNSAALPAAVWTMTVAGFAEETLYRGFLFERFGKIFGTGAWAKTLIVLLTSILFALSHYVNLGLPGVEQAMITGLVFGTIYAVTGRIFMLMIAHAAFDLTAVAIIYWNAESTVAHFVFK
ncbi:MAG: CPBP family intramembrane glutamic endopeptidase [Chitinophagales bacterium]